LGGAVKVQSGRNEHPIEIDGGMDV